MAKIGGAQSMAEVELSVQNFYFFFQVVQVFLVVTLASSATSVATKIISDPTKAASLLAKKLPTSSNFYVSYIVLQGLSFSSGALLQIGGLIIGKILGRLLDNTPRKMYSRWSTLAGLGWGTVYPLFTLLAVIGMYLMFKKVETDLTAITYSCIAPLVMGFATIGLYLFYFAYRYNLLYVSNAHIDTQGKTFARGLQQITVGCYLLVVCLIGLFAIATGARRIALGPLILTIILLIAMIVYHVSLNQALEPLINYLPKNLEAEELSLLSRETTVSKDTSGEQDGITDASPANGYENGAERVDSAEKGLTETTATQPQANFLVKYFRPDKYTGYHQLRQLVPKSDPVTYSPEVEQNAYHHPAIGAQMPLLWIPRDEMGISTQEVAHTSRVIPITDEEAWLDEKNHIHWDIDRGVPPIYEEKVFY